ncbi:MAG: hypothetical protein P8184_01175 [Calditrichia bacterium]
MLNSYRGGFFVFPDCMGKQVSNGVYFYEIKAGQEKFVGKMSLIK